MAYLNKIQLIGNLGQAPKIKATNTGRKVANFSVATDDGYFDKNSQQWVSQTTWHNVNAWGPLAEKIEKKALQKGASIYVEGSYRSRKWDDNGVQRTVFEVLATDVKFLDKSANGSNGQQGNAYGGTNAYNSQPQQGYQQPAYDAYNEDDDLPF